MAVRRIVANIPAAHPEDARRFYSDILGLTVVMDHGWIVTFASDETTVPQVSVASSGGSGMPVPDLSIEVDDLASIHAKLVAAGCTIDYGPVDEPWGVRRLFVRDPFGRLLNILAHN